jgi:predicted kinase
VHVPEVFLLVGMTGSGKTTYSRRVLEPAGAVRLSGDDPSAAGVRVRLLRELAAGRDVALDLGFWQRADRDEWKRVVESAGGRWRMLYFPVSRAELLARLAQRNRLGGAGDRPVTESDLDDFYARFAEPTDEGEEVVQPGSF